MMMQRIISWESSNDDQIDPKCLKMTMNQDKLHTFHLDGKQFRYLTSLWFMFLCHLKIFGINLVVRTLPMKLSFCIITIN